MNDNKQIPLDDDFYDDEEEKDYSEYEKRFVGGIEKMTIKKQKIPRDKEKVKPRQQFARTDEELQ